MSARPSGRRPAARRPAAPRAAREGGRRPRRGSDLSGRMLIAVPAGVLAIVAVDAGGLVWALVVLALGLACLHELYTLLARGRPVKIAGFLAAAGLVLAARFGSQFQVMLVAVAALPVTFALAVARPGDADHTLAIAITLLGVYWIGLAIAHVVLLRDLPHGDGILIDVLVGTFLGDAGALLGGRAMGRRPLAPTLSPSKTLEGLLFGMLTALFTVWVAGWYQDWLKGWQALVLGLAVAVAAPAGDLFESMVKRSAGVKDTGRLFGPHGGALDRLDAALFSVVAGYYVWVALR